MVRVAERTGMAPDEYLAWEREQPGRHEFFRGEVFAMAGGSLRHNALCASLIEALRNQLRGRCMVLTSDQRIVAVDRQRYVYPDISVVCGPVIPELGANDVLTNPTLLVEVLSSSTEQYDRGLKWEGYRRIASLTDYVLVSQATPQIEHYRRERTRTWTYQVAAAGERIVLSNEAVLDVDAIFAGMLELPGDDVP
jgi:Uma2 family endonuclease